MIAWLIIGGGIHGTYLSHLLVNKVGLNRDDVRVLDPYQKPMAAWNRNATDRGMRFLRSPATHNIDIPVLSLYRFAQSPAVKEMADFYTTVWRAFAEPVSEALRPCHPTFPAGRVADRSVVIPGALHEHNRHSLTAETSVGSIGARNVMLAMGLGEQPNWPFWTFRLQQAGSKIDRVFDPGSSGRPIFLKAQKA